MKITENDFNWTKQPIIGLKLMDCLVDSRGENIHPAQFYYVGKYKGEGSLKMAIVPVEAPGSKTKTTKCPYCNAKFENQWAPLRPEAKPTPNQFSICFSCNGFLRFDNDLELNTVDIEDLIKNYPEEYNNLCKVATAIRKSKNKK